jgi:lipopolysaccharide biosynthesis protein
MYKGNIFVKYLNRPTKEIIKSLLYPILQPWIKDTVTYQDWYHSRCFVVRCNDWLNINWWKKKLFLPHYWQTTQTIQKEMGNESSNKLAIIIHVFYLEVFKDMLRLLEFPRGSEIRLYITTPPSIASQVQACLIESRIPFEIRIFENRGRDMLPFLKILPEVLESDCDIVLKLHTKGSNHLKRKNLWHDDIINKLIGKNQLSNCLRLFTSFPRLGILAPYGHILPMSLYYGSNALRLKKLLNVTGFPCGLDFIAGSMFYARRNTLEPLLALRIRDSDFEDESGQLDGTMAHAIERVFTYFLPSTGYCLGDTHLKPGQRLWYKVTVNHRFTI